MEQIEIGHDRGWELLSCFDEPGIEIAAGDRSMQQRKDGNHVERNRNRSFDAERRLANNQLTHSVRPNLGEGDESSRYHHIALTGFRHEYEQQGSQTKIMQRSSDKVRPMARWISMWGRE